MRKRNNWLISLVLSVCVAGGAFAQGLPTVVRDTAFDWQCQAADGRALSNHQRYDTALAACVRNAEGRYIQGGRYRIEANQPETPQECEAAPAPDRRTAECPAGTVGSWEQVRPWVVAAHPACWLPGEWQPATPPAAACVTVPVGNQPPVISGAIPAGRVGAEYFYLPTASDPEGGRLTFSATGLPTWARLRESDGRITGTPDANGRHAVTIVVRDPAGNEARVTGDLVVTGGQEQPQPGNGRATLSWTAPTTNTDGTALTGLQGYRVHYGRSADALDQVQDVADPAAAGHVVQGLGAGLWWFGVRAVGAGGAESDLSNLASLQVR